MKVLKEKSREYNGKPYYKFKINIPEKDLVAAKMKEGDELKVKTEDGRIILEKSK